MDAGAGLSIVSKVLPATYGLDGIRRVLLEGRGFAEVTEPFVILLIMLGVLLPFPCGFSAAPCAVPNGKVA